MTDAWYLIETAPKDGTRIRIRPRYGLGLPEMDGAWTVYEGGRAGFAFVFGRNVDPTHWQPLPNPPAQQVR